MRGIPVLSATRSIIMLAPETHDERLGAVIDEACRRGVASHGLVAERSAELVADPGAYRVRRLVATGALAMESPLERRTFADIRRIDPPPETQVEDLVPGRFLDFAWRAYRYALESDGKLWHGMLTDRTNDNLRDLEAGAQEVIVHRLTHAMVTTRRAETLQLILRNLARRAEQLALPVPRL